MKKIFLPVVYICFAATACIKQVDIETRLEKSKLVVEGAVTTDSGPYTVKLTYSGHVRIGDAVPDSLLEKDAVVVISGDDGTSTAMEYTSNGMYQSTNAAFIGKVGHSYTINIQLKNGKKYVSQPETIPRAVPVDALHAAYVSDFDRFHPAYMNVYLDASDPAGEENFYKWDFLAWMPRKANGIGCGFGCIEYEYCFQHNIDSVLNITSDAAFNGNKINSRLMGKSYIYWFGRHYVDVKQRSLTRESYQFWEMYNDQQVRTGSILDPLPASIKGNVHNATDENDFALGYFSAEAVTHKKVILAPQSITDYLLGLSAKIFIPDGPGICFEVFPNTMPYAPNPAPQYPPPAGWENAEEISVSW